MADLGDGNVLRHDECQQLTCDEDPALPSKCVYFNGSDLFWSVNFLYDRLRDWGETRTLCKWRVFFQQSLQQSKLLTDLFLCRVHFFGNHLPVDALDDNVADSKAVLTYFYFITVHSRKEVIVQETRQLLCRLCNRVCEAYGHDSQLDLDIVLETGHRLVVNPQSGLVGGLVEAIPQRHRTALQAWINVWTDMFQANLLTCSMTEEMDQVPLRDVVMFAFGVNRFRKQGRRSPWDEATPSGSMLLALVRALITFFSEGLLSYIVGQYQLEHDVGKAVPSRRVSGGSGGKVSMSADSIWEVLEHAGGSSVSAREALAVIGPNSRLSSAGGCCENAVDAWVRRWQIIYDERAAFTTTGANHFNLVADASTHSGKDCLVSVLWCHENNCAMFAPIQVIQTGDSLYAGEIDLTSLAEKLAKDWTVILIHSIHWCLFWSYFIFHSWCNLSIQNEEYFYLAF